MSIPNQFANLFKGVMPEPRLFSSWNTPLDRKFPPIAWNVKLAPSHYPLNGRGAREMCPNGGGPAVEELVPPMKPVVEELSTCFKHILLYYIRELIPPS